MTRFTVPIADILGNAYYTYEMTASTYTPTIDTSFTITVTVKTIFGNPVGNKSLTLYKDGTSVGSFTTDEYGRAYWNITLSDWNTHHFNCNNATMELSANNWKLMETKESNKVRVYANENMVALSIQDSFTLTANGNRTIATISSQYAPNYTITTNFHPTTHQTKTTIDATGGIIVYNNSTATSGIARIYVTYPLKARMP